VHGRWGTDAYNGQVVNVIGLPTSKDQREVKYTIPELEILLTQMKDLQRRLAILRELWPI
jgi:hypothetical protein